MRKRPKLIRPNTYKHLRKVIVNKTQAMRCA